MQRLQALIDGHYPRILRAASALTGDSWEAQDLAQETFLQALRAHSSFAERSEVGTWLYSILLNLHRKRRRSLSRHRHL